MRLEQWRPRFTAEFGTVARRHAADIAAALVIFVVVSLAAGRVWRFAFDDEIYSLHAVERLPLAKLLVYYTVGNDVHPPLAYVLTGLLHRLGLGEAGMRLVGLALTGLALALFQALALTLAARRGPVTPLTRAVAILLFGLNALAISEGDTLRWYPLFAAEIAVAITLYVAAANDAARVASAIVIGLAASTNVLTILVLPPLALYRYGLERRFVWRIDVALWLLVPLFGCLGIAAAIWMLAVHPQFVGTQLGFGVIAAAGVDALGFFGGHALGLGQAWIVVPPLIVSLIAVFGVIDRKAPADPAHLLIMLLIAVLAMPLIGFGKPRSFLYLAPVMAAVQTLYLDQLARRRVTAALVATALLVAPAAAAIANIQGPTHPFKRNAAVPYDAIIGIIDANADGKALVVSMDPVLPWALAHGQPHADRCASYFFDQPACFADVAGYRTIFIVSGHHNRSDNLRFTRQVAERLTAIVAGRQKLATVPVGVDDDALLKSRLSGVPLGRPLLTVDIYR